MLREPSVFRAVLFKPECLEKFCIEFLSHCSYLAFYFEDTGFCYTLSLISGKHKIDFIGKLRADEGEEGGGNNAGENSFFISSSSVCYGTTHTEQTTPFPQIHTEYF